MSASLAFPITQFPRERLACTLAANEAISAEGFVPVRAAFQLPKAKPAILVNAKGADDWYQLVHSRAQLVPELGLHFVDDVTVCGFLAAYKDGAFLEDAAEHYGVVREFAQTENIAPETRLTRAKVTEIDQTGLVIGGPGYLIWGHWLVDYMPRLALAQIYWGRGAQPYVIPLPSDTPGWVFAFLKFFCGVEQSQFVLYDRATEVLKFKRVCVPSYVHDGGLHSFMLETFQPLLRNVEQAFPRKICVSRRNLGPTQSVARLFRQQQLFEECAVAAGYTLIQPEKFSFREQLDMFHGATHVVGEYGSGMHNAIFSKPGTVVGQVCMPNPYQSRISELCGHVSVFLFPDKEVTQENGQVQISVEPHQVEAFFKAVEEAL